MYEVQSKMENVGSGWTEVSGTFTDLCDAMYEMARSAQANPGHIHRVVKTARVVIAELGEMQELEKQEYESDV